MLCVFNQFDLVKHYLIYILCGVCCVVLFVVWWKNCFW